MKKARKFAIATGSIAIAGVLALAGAAGAQAEDSNWGTPPAGSTVSPGPETAGPGEVAAPADGSTETASTAMDSNWG